MPTPEERALLTDIGDKLLQLYATRDEAPQPLLREMLESFMHEQNVYRRRSSSLLRCATAYGRGSSPRRGDPPPAGHSGCARAMHAPLTRMPSCRRA